MDPTQPIHPEPEGRVSEEHERARVLADVLRDQAERARAARTAEVRQHRRSRLRQGLTAAVWVTCAYIWLAAPGWTRVEQPPVPTLAEDVHALRLNLFLQTQQVEAFRNDRGRLPWVLEETGPPLPGMEYERLDGRRYEIEARSRRVRLSYTSERAPLQFVGSAAHVLSAGDPGEAFPTGAAPVQERSSGAAAGGSGR